MLLVQIYVFLNRNIFKLHQPLMTYDSLFSPPPRKEQGMSTILGVGAGVFILAILWTIALAAIVLLAHLDSAVSTLSMLSAAAVLLVTLVLWYIPRQPDAPPNGNETYDSTYITRLRNHP